MVIKAVFTTNIQTLLCLLQNIQYSEELNGSLFFKLKLEIIKTNILSKIHDDYFKNKTSRALTRFSFDLAW